MKRLLFLLIIAIMVSCSSDSSSNSSIYNPPSWIQGKWGIKANGTTVLNDYLFYRFTSNNVCQITGNGVSTLCWKDAIEQTPTILSGSDTSTSTTYTANFGSTTGATTTLSFEKISANKILWINTSSGGTVLDRLD